MALSTSAILLDLAKVVTAVCIARFSMRAKIQSVSSAPLSSDIVTIKSPSVVLLFHGEVFVGLLRRGVSGITLACR
jgi:hypothetical protein